MTTWTIQVITPASLPPRLNTFRAHYTNFYDAQDLQEEEGHQAKTQMDGQEEAHPEAAHQEEDPLEAQDMEQI